MKNLNISFILLFIYLTKSLKLENKLEKDREYIFKNFENLSKKS